MLSSRGLLLPYPGRLLPRRQFLNALDHALAIRSHVILSGFTPHIRRISLVPRLTLDAVIAGAAFAVPWASTAASPIPRCVGPRACNSVPCHSERFYAPHPKNLSCSPADARCCHRGGCFCRTLGVYCRVANSSMRWATRLQFGPMSF